MRVSLRALFAMSLGLIAAACSGTPIPFAAYQQETFGETAITTAQEKTVRLANPYPDEPQHIRVIAFDAGGNAGGHFQIKRVVAGERELPPKDVVIPGGSVVEITFAYVPKNLTTTRASWGGVETGQPARNEPQVPKSVYPNPLYTLAGAIPHPRRFQGKAAAAPPQAIHRALVILTYDHPGEGVIQIELIGRAVPGPKGEMSVAGGVTTPGECVAEGTTACFTGQFGVELPGLMKGGPALVELAGPLPITIEDAAATIAMNAFPPALFVVKGNGPGEPLEGKPIGAITLVVTGAPDLVATGTFDGSSLQLNGIGFRIRLYLAELTLEDAETTTAPVDFLVTDLMLTTATPLAGNTMTLQIETTLGSAPSGNPLVDPFLAGAKVVVTLDGMLQLP